MLLLSSHFLSLNQGDVLRRKYLVHIQYYKMVHLVYFFEVPIRKVTTFKKREELITTDWILGLKTLQEPRDSSVGQSVCCSSMVSWVKSPAHVKVGCGWVCAPYSHSAMQGRDRKITVTCWMPAPFQDKWYPDSRKPSGD